MDATAPNAVTDQDDEPIQRGLVEACHRAPTLMAGERAGQQGQVKVWVPDLKSIRTGLWHLIGCALFAVLYGLIIQKLFHASEVAIFSGLAFPMLIANQLRKSLRRPGYLTTDDVGIGITTLQGSDAISWNDVQSLDFHPDGFYESLLKTASYGSIKLNLLGYACEEKEAIRLLIVERARLQPHPVKKSLFIRPSPSLAPPAPRGR